MHQFHDDPDNVDGLNFLAGKDLLLCGRTGHAGQPCWPTWTAACPTWWSPPRHGRD
ncbi:MAG: hypothetical protein ACLRWQ_06525 [Flavonifractor plautii]